MHSEESSDVRRYVKREMKIVLHRKIFANFSSDHNS